MVGFDNRGSGIRVRRVEAEVKEVRLGKREILAGTVSCLRIFWGGFRA